MTYYKKHIFLCTNEKIDGRKCCNAAGATPVYLYLQSKIKAMGLSGKGGIRVSSSGCMGRCLSGPVMVIYPEQVWYTYKTNADIDEILLSHIKRAQVVKRLLVTGSVISAIMP